MIILRTVAFSFRSDIPEEIKLSRLVLKKNKDSWFTRKVVSFIVKTIIKLFKPDPRKVRNMETVADFSIMEGKNRIGDLSLTKMSKDEINIMWIEVDEEYRGRGYAQEILGWVVQYSRDSGYKEITLEVPGISPDARHIYEKLGFHEVGQITSPDEDFYWGGLTGMKMKLI